MVGHSRYTVAAYLVLGLAACVTITMLAWKPKIYAPEVMVPLLIAILAGFGILLQLQGTREVESERRQHELGLAREAGLLQARMQTFADRKKAYGAMVEPFRKAMLAKHDPAAAQWVPDAKAMVEAKFDLLYYGSDSTLLALNRFLGLASKVEAATDANKAQRSMANLVFFARYIMAVRADLGLATGELDEYELLKVIITDIGQHETRFREALAWTSPTEVP